VQAMYEERFYREWVRSPDLVSFRVVAGESDLLISAERNLGSAARAKAAELRSEIESYIGLNRKFADSLEPVEVGGSAPAIVQDMAGAGKAYSVGPMAAVAGAIARHVGLALLSESSELIIENGGDIFMCSRRARVVSVFAGSSSPFGEHLRISVDSRGEELGVCTSSGTVGPSLSFGKADAVTAIASSATLADAAATAICNSVKSPSDIEPAVEREKERGLLRGLLIVMGNHVGAWGEMEFAS